MNKERFSQLKTIGKEQELEEKPQNTGCKNNLKIQCYLKIYLLSQVYLSFT